MIQKIIRFFKRLIGRGYDCPICGVACKKSQIDFSIQVSAWQPNEVYVSPCSLCVMTGKVSDYVVNHVERRRSGN